MLQTKREIQAWLDNYNIQQYIINEDLTVDVDTDVDLYGQELIEIPIQFGIIEGDFQCNSNILTSLKGCPFEIKRNFNCSLNPITNLEFSPKIIKGDFKCYSTPLKSLMGFDSRLGGYFKHSCQSFEQYKILELSNYYIEKDNTILGGKYWDLELSGMEINNIISLIFLKNELSNNLNKINANEKKQLKI